MNGLKSSEIHWVAHTYIGVSEGYLGDFSYRTHREFYRAYCDLEIDSSSYSGQTTREKFLAILSAAQPRDQAAILKGVARKYPADSEAHRTAKKFNVLLGLIKDCTEAAAVGETTPAISSEIVHHALQDAAALLDQRSPVSALDRVHTALHAYLKAACARCDIQAPEQASMTSLLKLLRQQHPCLSTAGQHEEAATRILQSLSNVVDSLNPLRNHGSSRASHRPSGKSRRSRARDQRYPDDNSVSRCQVRKRGISTGNLNTRSLST